MCLLIAALPAACAPREPMFERRNGFMMLLRGSNGVNHRMADGIYQLVVRDIRDKHEINPMHMMMYFAAELTLEQNYEGFVLLPHDERPYEEAQIRELRDRVYSGEFNQSTKKTTIRVRTKRVCTNGICSTSYSSKAIVVMVNKKDSQKALVLDARKVYDKFKGFVPTRENEQS